MGLSGFIQTEHRVLVPSWQKADLFQSNGGAGVITRIPAQHNVIIRPPSRESKRPIDDDVSLVGPKALRAGSFRRFDGAVRDWIKAERREDQRKIRRGCAQLN